MADWTTDDWRGQDLRRQDTRGKDWRGKDWSADAWSRGGPAGALVAPRREHQPVPRPAWARHPRLAGAALAALLACGLGLALHARRAAELPAAEEAHPVLEPPAWSPILRPVPSFVLDTPLFSADQVSLAARRHNPGGGREEIIGLGRPGIGQAFARVIVYRAGSEAGPPGTLFLELARRGAEDGFALLRSVQPAPLPTKFGLVETADVALLGEGGEHRCTAWRIVADEQDLRVTGWLCGAAGKPVERATVACLVDRLQLSPAQTDAGLRAFFKDADRHRTPGCPAPRPVSAARRPA